MRSLITLVLIFSFTGCSHVNLYTPQLEELQEQSKALNIVTKEPLQSGYYKAEEISLVNPIPRDEAVLRLRIIWPKESENE